MTFFRSYLAFALVCLAMPLFVLCELVLWCANWLDPDSISFLDEDDDDDDGF